MRDKDQSATWRSHFHTTVVDGRTDRRTDGQWAMLRRLCFCLCWCRGLTTDSAVWGRPIEAKIIVLALFFSLKISQSTFHAELCCDEQISVHILAVNAEQNFCSGLHGTCLANLEWSIFSYLLLWKLWRQKHHLIDLVRLVNPRGPNDFIAQKSEILKLCHYIDSTDVTEFH